MDAARLAADARCRVPDSGGEGGRAPDGQNHNTLGRPSEEQAALLRDVVGNPFVPAEAPSQAWLAWNRRAVTRLARAAYRERLLPSGCLDSERLGILADALEDAGCDRADLVEHLRSPGPHVRGCWAVDFVLGQE
jgi:hypothetical protein